LTLREEIRDIIRQSVSSQLFLLKHEEIGDAIQDMDILADAILEATRKRVPSKHKIEKYKDIEWCEPCQDSEKTCGYNEAIDAVLKEME
jgi:hypothetical protein